MFKTTITEPTRDVMETSEPIPLSHLALDLDPPEFGWHAYLAGRNIEIVLDDLGRDAISRVDARRLFDEGREAEVRKAQMRAAAERQAIESDRQWRAQLPRGVPWYQIPDGVLPVQALAQAARDARPKRTTLLQEQLSNSQTLTFHPIEHDADES